MREVAEAYDRWSATYDADHNATRDLDALVLRRAALPVAGAAVLELGCGTGKNTRWLAAAASVHAIDFSAGMLERAQAAIPDAHVRFERHDISEPWPVTANSIDVVIGNLVLEHLRDLSPVFASAARALRPNGLLYLCELHPYRQLRGGQAHFKRGDETIHVPAFVHTVSEYVNGGVSAGLTLVQLGEWLEEGAVEGAPPRLLSVTFRRP